MALDLPSIRAHDAEPVTAQNPPFRSRVSYHADDYSTLRYKLIAHLQDAFPNWNSAVAGNQGTQDFGVVFAEMFSYLAEILGFYQDCQANEAFLRTAVLPSSLADLCELIGYRPAPGASASVLQVFLLKAGQTGLIPAGFQVKTKGKDGKPALVFETDADLNAGAARNTLNFSGYNRSTRVLNATGAPAEATVLLDSGYGGLDAGSFVVFSAPNRTARAVRLTAVTDEKSLRRITWQAGDLPAGANIPIADLTIYGRPAQAMKLAEGARADEVALGQVTARVTHASSFVFNDHIIFVAPGFMQSAVVLSRSGGSIHWDRAFNTPLRRSETVIYNAGHDGFAVAGGPFQPGDRQITSDNYYLTPAKAGDLMVLDGGNSLDVVRVAARSGNTYYLSDVVPRPYQSGATLFKATPADPEASVAGDPHSTIQPLRINRNLTQLTLDKTYDGLTPGALVVLSDGVYTRVNAVASTQVDGQNRTILTLKKKVGAPFLTGPLTIYGPFKLQMRVNGYNVAEGTIAAGLTSIKLDGAVTGLATGSYIALADGKAVEGVRITGVFAGSGFTSIDLETPLQNSYAPATTVIYGNVVSATHGQTVIEKALGSGDQSVANQSFKLHQKPVTYAHSAAGARGVANTLEIFVQGEKWRELETLAASGPQDHHYTVSVDEDQWMSVTFGDGKHGAKLPTGRDNVSSQYRVGLGIDGNVAAGEINSLTAPPSFLLSSFNPVAAAGGQDRETPQRTKMSAPVTIRTLNRAVSVEDYSDLALSYAGIAKARAYWQRIEGRHVIRLVVATTGGHPLPAPLQASLAAYLDLRRSPQHGVLIQGYRPWPVRLVVNVRLLPQLLQFDVRNTILAALGSGEMADGTPGYFNFDRRDLGADLYLSDIYAAVQSIPGVDYAIVRQFHDEAHPNVGALDVIRIPDDALATGGDPTDHTIGVLTVHVTGGIA